MSIQFRISRIDSNAIYMNTESKVTSGLVFPTGSGKASETYTHMHEYLSSVTYNIHIPSRLDPAFVF